MRLVDRVQRGWNAFKNNRDPTTQYTYMQETIMILTIVGYLIFGKI